MLMSVVNDFMKTQPRGRSMKKLVDAAMGHEVLRCFCRTLIQTAIEVWQEENP